MAIYIDSAKEDEVRQAKEYGWIKGVTTNPVLLAQAGVPAEATLKRLAAFGFSCLFYQLVSSDEHGMVVEARLALKIVGNALVLKVPPTEAGFRFVTEHATRYPCCVTAVYSPAQALAAREAGAQYVAVYVNRAMRLKGDGIRLVEDISKCLIGSRTEIVAASLKSPEEAGSAFLAGASHLTLPFDVLQALLTHPLSIATLDRFVADGVGLVPKS